MVSAGAADRHQRLPVLRDDVVDQRRARALVWLEYVGMAPPEIQHLHPGAEGAADFREVDRLGKTATARSCTYHVAVAVQCGDVGGAAVVACAVARNSCRRRSLRPGSGCGGVTPRVARGRQVGRRPRRVDERRAFRRVLLGQQTVHRNRGEVGVPVVGLPVRESQLERLCHGVDVLRRVVPHRPEVETLQDIQRLVQHRALCPGRLAVDVVAVEAGGDGLLVLGVIAGEVFHTEDAAHALCALDDVARDVAAVEGVPRGAYALAPVAGGGAFGGDHAPENIGQPRLHQHRAGRWHFAIVVEHRRAAGRVKLELTPGRGVFHAFQHVLVVRDSAFGVVYRRRQHLGQGSSAVAIDERQQRVDDAGDRE